MELPANYNELHYTERKKVREEYARLQKGLCKHCGKPLSENASDEIMAMRINKRLFPESFFKWPVHLHHDHNTGMTIGAVHCHCNAVLWKYNGE
jgi:hypothetical protein